MSSINNNVNGVVIEDLEYSKLIISVEISWAGQKYNPVWPYDIHRDIEEILICGQIEQHEHI
jgi:hypothetical protein